MKETGNRKKTVANILTVLFLLSEVIFLAMILTSGIFASKYLIFAACILLVMTAVTIPLVRSPKGRRKAGYALAVIFSIFLAFGSYYLYSTTDLFGEISGEDKQAEDFYVVVLKDGSYESIDDIVRHTVYITSNQSDSYKEAKDRLKEDFEVEYETAGDYISLGQKLISKDGKQHDEIIYLSSINYDMICETDATFKDSTKILDTVSIEVENTDVTKPTNVTEKTFNIYISGIDTFGSIDKVARSDVNMIMTVDPVNKKILLTSIPRDTYVTLHSYGAKDKLTHSGIYGIDETVKTVEDWLGIDINYYLRVNFTTLEDVVDVIGGIEVNSEYSFRSSVGNYSFVKGINYLNGEAALCFARERYSFASGDLQRVKNQQLVIEGIIKKLMSNKSLLVKYPQLLGTLKNQIKTNMSDKEISALVKMQLNDMAGWDIQMQSITGTGDMRVTYSGGSGRLSVIIPDDNSVSSAVTAIKQMSTKES